MGLLLSAVAALAAGAEAFRDCAECPEMVAVPAGAFVMGAAPGEEDRESLAAEFRNRSEPQRTVRLRRFFAGRFEVTRGEYRAFAEATGRASDGCFIWQGAAFELDRTKDWRDPGYAQHDGHPATCVSWEDASAYATWLSQKTGKRYRLLTESEWEYAARAGTRASRFWGDDRSIACDFANGGDLATHAKVPGASSWHLAACDDRHAYTAPVGSYRPNAFGLYDMLGNVEEWTEDCWNRDLRATPDDGSAASGGDCTQRAVRGGSWLDSPVGVRASYRVGSPVTIRVYRRGFRVAAD